MTVPEIASKGQDPALKSGLLKRSDPDSGHRVVYRKYHALQETAFEKVFICRRELAVKFPAAYLLIYAASLPNIIAGALSYLDNVGSDRLPASIALDQERRSTATFRSRPFPGMSTLRS